MARPGASHSIDTALAPSAKHLPSTTSHQGWPALSGPGFPRGIPVVEGRRGWPDGGFDRLRFRPREANSYTCTKRAAPLSSRAVRRSGCGWEPAPRRFGPEREQRPLRRSANLDEVQIPPDMEGLIGEDFRLVSRARLCPAVPGIDPPPVLATVLGEVPIRVA